MSFVTDYPCSTGEYLSNESSAGSKDGLSRFFAVAV
jgi:hypothetical protein